MIPATYAGEFPGTATSFLAARIEARTAMIADLQISSTPTIACFAFSLLSSAMPELEAILVSVWRQALVDGAKFVQIGDEKYAVRETSRRRLKQVDFRFEKKRK
jgi:hypothetical protein